MDVGVKPSDVSGKTLLIPEMAPFGSHLIAACFRAMGTDAVVMETYKGVNLGREFTSGKECFPCQVTLGDILHHLRKEKERLGPAFSPEQYVYFLPEADGPCRFGMYNKLQRLILDRFEEFKEVPIVYLSTEDAYSTGSIMPPERASAFRRLSYVAIIIADVLDRTVWRVRPYEWRPGMTDEFMKKALEAMVSMIETVGADLNFKKMYRMLEDIVATAASFIDPHQPRRPRIGIVGEIYLRSHPDSNQNIVRQLERFGAEVVDASIGEWINFITFVQARKLQRQWKLAQKIRDHKAMRQISRQWLANRIEILYQSRRQNQVYRCALKHLDIEADHTIRSIERRLDRNRLYSFDIGTEAALSIGGALEYVHHGFDGIVNVFPFTCMPSTICTAVLKPLLHKMKVPYIDAPYDGGIQPNREVALRTFAYQARQHLASRKTGQTLRH
ncbi:MAG: CoA activase [Deltaproteobacteria bacterium]|nr:CoA activase [Deltaproteobacteria bacterium]